MMMVDEDFIEYVFDKYLVISNVFTSIPSPKSTVNLPSSSCKWSSLCWVSQNESKSNNLHVLSLLNAESKHRPKSHRRLLSGVHLCSKFFQLDVHTKDTLKYKSPDYLEWYFSIDKCFERFDWQMALFLLSKKRHLLANCNVPPSFCQLLLLEPLYEYFWCSEGFRCY